MTTACHFGNSVEKITPSSNNTACMLHASFKDCKDSIIPAAATDLPAKVNDCLSGLQGRALWVSRKISTPPCGRVVFFTKTMPAGNSHSGDAGESAASAGKARFIYCFILKLIQHVF
jgi:hypothetical protein